MEREVKTFSQIGSIAFGEESSSNNALLFLETMKDAIRAAKGMEVPQDADERFDKVMPALYLASDQAQQSDPSEDNKKADDINFQIQMLTDMFRGKENVILSLDEMFHSYLSTSEGRSGEDMAQMYELIMALKKFFR